MNVGIIWQLAILAGTVVAEAAIIVGNMIIQKRRRKCPR